MDAVNQRMEAMEEGGVVVGCTARVALGWACVPLPGSAVFLSLALATLVAQANPRMIPGQNGNACPGGTSFAGAGYCKVR